QDGDNTIAAAHTLRDQLTVEETAHLLHEAPAAYRCQLQDLLLVALVQTLSAWAGGQYLRIDLEGHGREELEDEDLFDVSRTVGWFTSLYPVLFHTPSSGADLDTWIKTIKEQLRAVLHKGVGYGLHRYVSEDQESVQQLQAASPSQVIFNYLGQFDQMLEALPLAPESSGLPAGTQNLRSHLFDVSAGIVAGQLHVMWTYSTSRHRQETVEGLAQQFFSSLRQLLSHCLAPEAGSVTPSDVPLARVDQSFLDQLSIPAAQIEDLYPLSPMQQGLLFHSLYAPASGVYVEQLICQLQGKLDLPAFEQVWQHLIAQHAILRTAFLWQEGQEPLQLVARQVALPCRVLDWRAQPAEQQQAELEVFLQEDRRTGFEVQQAPLMRLTLIRLSETQTTVIWSHHHLLLDGWSTMMLLQEVFAGYDALWRKQRYQPEGRGLYREYIAWLQKQHTTQAQTYWQQYLAGVTLPTPLGVDREERAGSVVPGNVVYGEEVLKISLETSARWQELARQQQVTFNTLLQGAWAYVLSRYSGQTDVVFGQVVSGRS
ncbi:MAG TPA: condensation domain-containing protein, partial [Ktedonobacteraceae bacterium]